MKPSFITKQGLEELTKEESNLFEKRKTAVSQVSKAREMGDLSENGFYKSAKQELFSIDRRLRQIKHILLTSQVIKKSSSSKVVIGSKVEVLTEGEAVEYQIVGAIESNPSKGKISNESPVGKALLGKKVGDKFRVMNREYKILKIS